MTARKRNKQQGRKILILMMEFERECIKAKVKSNRAREKE